MSRKLSDARALTAMARMLRAPEWDSAADYLEAIAELVTMTGRDITHPEGTCDGCGLNEINGQCEVKS